MQETVKLPTRALKLRAPQTQGFFVVEARLRIEGQPRAVHRAGFWMRDRAFLRSGPRLTVDQDFFALDGRPLAVMGTTYMASDVQRLFFARPNPFVWERDLAALAADGLNMIRTGWWSDWDSVCDPQGRPHPRALRTLEAYLMSARRHGLPVQLTYFAFLPEVLGGENPYFDPRALERQRTLIDGVVRAFADVPFLAWDLINEPSFSHRLWSDRPSGDRLELARWNEWLSRAYPDRAALADAWDRPALEAEGAVPLPAEREFDAQAAYSGRGSLALHDYHLFAQESFAGWAGAMVETIRAAGSRQLVTIGQDEGGFLGRPSPQFFGRRLDFTTNHSWWGNDTLLWDSLVAKQPGLPMLIQETGYQRELTLNQAPRRDPAGEAALVARKLALSFVQGAGAIQWLWHTNAFMTQGNEVSIGAVRADGTEKPEADVVRAFARFARALGPHLRAPERPPVAIVASQAAQLSVLRELPIEAQQTAVRALAYDARHTAYIIADNQIDRLGTPGLVILPSVQALTEATWRALLDHVSAGGNLLVTGAVERDQHWHLAHRIEHLWPDATLAPVTYRTADLALPGRTLRVDFAQKKQAWLEGVRFGDGAGLRELAHGKGRLFWAAQPVELAENRETTGALYTHVLARVGIAPLFQGPRLPTGVLVYPTLLADAVLYVVVSERADAAALAFTDRTTGAKVALTLPAGGTALWLLRRSDGAVLAKLGF